MTKKHWNALFLIFIMASLVVDFTAAYILRWQIHDLYATHPVNESSKAIELIDKIASQSFVFHYAVGIAIGIIFMSVLVWGLQFGIKED